MQCSVFLLTVLMGMVAIAAVPDTRIVNGEDAKVGQFPYQVSLRYSFTTKDHFCGGAILSERWVVTVAHCVTYKQTYSILVFTGSINIYEGDEYAVDTIIGHDQYNNPPAYNDIGLVRTKKAIQFSDVVQPIPLRMKPVVGQESGIATGWGKTSYPGGQSSILQFLEMKTLTNEECKEKQIPDFVEYLNEGHLCVFKAAGAGMCMGDSGGPLAINGELVGLVSWGVKCAKGYPDVFTRISTFEDWLKENMAKNE